MCYQWVLIAIVTVVIGGILGWVSLMEDRGIREIAVSEARIQLHSS